MRERTVPDPLQDGSTSAPLTLLQQLQRLNSRQEAVEGLRNESLTASLAQAFTRQH